MVGTNIANSSRKKRKDEPKQCEILKQESSNESREETGVGNRMGDVYRPVLDCGRPHPGRRDMVNISPLFSNGNQSFGCEILDEIMRLYEMGVLDDLEASRAHGRMTRRINAFLLKVRDGIDLNDYETGAEK